MALPVANDKGNKKGKKSAASMLQNAKFGGKTVKPVNISKKPIKTGGTRGS